MKCRDQHCEREAEPHRNFCGECTRYQLRVLVDNYLNVAWCPGNRPVAEGLICPHCQHDWSDGECGEETAAEREEWMAAKARAIAGQTA